MRLSDCGQFYEATRAARKILVVDLGFLGDTLHLVPALWEIKRHYPEAELHVLSSVLGAEVLTMVRCVDGIWPLEILPGKRSWWNQWRTIQQMRRKQFDLAFSFGTNDRTLILTGLTGARWRIAPADGRKHFWSRWLVPHRVPGQAPELAVCEQRRRMLAASGFRLAPTRFDLTIDQAALAWSAGVVPPGAIHLSVNSANPLKEWPLECHRDLLRQIWRGSPGQQVVATVGTKERERIRIREVAAAVDDARFHVLSDPLAIRQLAAVLLRCRLHIGPDSGVMHLAAALGIRTISFFREQGSFRAWLPVGVGHRIFSEPCSCIDHQVCPCERNGRAECLARIAPARVAEAVAEMLE